MRIPVRYPLKPIKYVGEIPTPHRQIVLKEVRPWQLRLCLRDKQSPVELWKKPLVKTSADKSPALISTVPAGHTGWAPERRWVRKRRHVARRAAPYLSSGMWGSN